MNDYTILPPKQAYMTLAQISEKFGCRGVVAYKCKVVDSVPQGGYVIAVQNKADEDYNGLREYLRQLKKKYPDKSPIYFIRFNNGVIAYDDGLSVKSAKPAIEFKDSPALEAINSIPDELLAKALSSGLKVK